MSDPVEWEGLTESTKKLFRLEAENKALQAHNERLRKALDWTVERYKEAKAIGEELRQLVPKPPNAITWERGVEILNHVQKLCWPTEEAKAVLEEKP